MSAADVESLVALQDLDSSADHLTTRRARLPEREAAAEAVADLTALRSRRAALVARDGELVEAIETLESEGRTLTDQRTRLERQLRTVVAPREADALTHELSTLAGRRDEMDDRELAHLDEQANIAAELAALDAQLPGAEAAAADTGGALAAAEAVIDAQLAEIVAARAGRAAGLDHALLDRYERLRSRLGGVAVARLDGRRCTGCHLEISAAELERVRATPAGQLADCPECGRLLVP